jgi:hypothetical protein
MKGPRLHVHTDIPASQLHIGHDALACHQLPNTVVSPSIGVRTVALSRCEGRAYQFPLSPPLCPGQGPIFPPTTCQGTIPDEPESPRSSVSKNKASEGSPR